MVRPARADGAGKDRAFGRVTAERRGGEARSGGRTLATVGPLARVYQLFNKPDLS